MRLQYAKLFGYQSGHAVGLIPTTQSNAVIIATRAYACGFRSGRMLAAGDRRAISFIRQHFAQELFLIYRNSTFRNAGYR